MTPVVSIIGRPNVGKSSLFNRLVRRRSAIVHDMPGVTRDRKTAVTELDGKKLVLVDTGGLLTGELNSIEKGVAKQVVSAIEESSLLLFVCDGRDGVLPQDRDITSIVRKSGKPVLLVVNKMDGVELTERATPAFHELAIGEPIPISAEHGLGIDGLRSLITENLPQSPSCEAPETDGDESEGQSERAAKPENIRIAVVGRPNAGKSTLVNRLLGTERMLVSEIPGTTRDAIDSELDVKGRHYTLIDTAGIRRKRSIEEDVEKICVSMAIDAIGRSDVVLLILDSAESFTEQDLRIAGQAVEKGRALVILANKWDLARKKSTWRDEEHYIAELRYAMKFLGFSPVICLSGKTGQGTEKILPVATRAYDDYVKKVPTHKLTELILQLQKDTPPPVSGSKRIKFYYAAQTGIKPPVFSVITNMPDAVHFSYRRMMVNAIRERFGFDAVPVKVNFKARKKKERGR